jgi:hypothetical protein
MTSELSGSDIALILTAIGTLVSAVASSCAVVIGSMNASKLSAQGLKQDTQGTQIAEVHKTTNGLSERAEAFARSTGLAEGNLQGRLDQTAERKTEADQERNNANADRK